MNASTRVRLSVMMFLQFVVWGSWYGQLSKYLLSDAVRFDGEQVGVIYATFSAAMIVSPFLVGMLADRFFAAQRVLAFLNLVGAGLLFWLAKIIDYDLFFLGNAFLLSHFRTYYRFDQLHFSAANDRPRERIPSNPRIRDRCLDCRYQYCRIYGLGRYKQYFLRFHGGFSPHGFLFFDLTTHAADYKGTGKLRADRG